MQMTPDVIIIGGGLSGLALADHLQKAGKDYLVLEARNRLGGRIKSAAVEGGFFDLGPSWFWPGQPRLAHMVKRFDLTVFEQYADGALCFEDEHGQVRKHYGASAMAGANRIQGGMAALVSALSKALRQERIITNAPVAKLYKTDGINVELTDGRRFKSKQIVLALPPRLAAQTAFDPALPPHQLEQMRAIPTWMGGHAKFVAVYKRPFWRGDGLSGDTISRAGPLVEIHDATDPKTGQGALFGFLGVPAKTRLGQDANITKQALQQLTRLFGQQAADPVQTLYQDWAPAPETSTQQDWPFLNHHPAYGLPSALSEIWENRVHMGSTEVAPQFGGFLEGALETAERVAEKLIFR